MASPVVPTGKPLTLEEFLQLPDQKPVLEYIGGRVRAHVEIISPRLRVASTYKKRVRATSQGCPLGWRIDPERKTIDVYRQGHPPQRLAGDGAREGEPVLPGFRLPVAEVPGWLRPGRRAAGADPA